MLAEIKTIARLHYLTQDLQHISHAAQAEAACRGGVEWIQFRTKNRSGEDWKKEALEVQQVAKAYHAKLIINDNPQLAFEIQADGVHLGKQDMSPMEARQILGPDAIIGGTANSEEDVLRLLGMDADYIGLGPFRFTSTKQNLSPVLSYNEITKLAKYQEKVPIILIGGITVNDLQTIAAAGVYGVAVSSAINLAEDAQAAAGNFMSTIRKLFENE